nr:protein BASIC PENTACYSTEINE2-like [Ipomoea batatas]
MDDDGLNMRNWGYYEPSHKGPLGLQLMPSVVDRDTRTFFSGRENPSMMASNGLFHPRDSVVSQASSLTHIDYIRDGWINHRDKFLHMFPGNPYGGGVMADPSGTQTSMQMLQTDSTKEEIANVEDPSVGKDSCPSKKRPAAAASPPKAKKPKKGPSAPKKNDNPPAQRAKPAKKSIEVVISGIDMDISSIPTPVCTCTGTPQQCYRWGCGGWQSACCTTTISMYPLPMNNKRRGARIAGRKMSQGAFKKVLEKLASEGYNFSDPIDLRTYWAKHGTNKFVTIR